MNEKDAIEQLEKLLLEVENYEKEVMTLEQAMAEYEREKAQTTYESRRHGLRLRKLESALHQCNKIVHVFSQAVANETDKSQEAYLKRSKELSLLLNQLIEKREVIVRAVSEKNMEAYAKTLTSKEAVLAKLKMLKLQQNPDLVIRSYIKVLEAKLSSDYLESNGP